MKLLIVTQKVEEHDPILGFFIRWIEEFRDQCDAVSVIGQRVGVYADIEGVQLHSLGKEHGHGRLYQVLTFWKTILFTRKDYDAVLVHMTPIWVVLGAPLWWLLRKHMYLWYEARGTRWPLRIALQVCNKIFSASDAGMPLVSDKSVVTGHGIDTNAFVLGTSVRNRKTLMTVGRITRAKRIDVLVRSMCSLPEYRLDIVGHPITDDDKVYASEIVEFIDEHGLGDRIAIITKTQTELQSMLQTAFIFVHASTTPLDKAVLEAMASGCIVLSSSDAIQPYLLPLCHATEQTFASRIQDITALSEDQIQELVQTQRTFVEKEHSLSELIGRLVGEMQ